MKIIESNSDRIARELYTAEHNRKLDEDHRAKNPYDLLLILDGSRAVRKFGRFPNPAWPHQVGQQLLVEMRPNYRAFNKVTVKYFVEDTRTGMNVNEHGVPLARLAESDDVESDYEYDPADD